MRNEDRKKARKLCSEIVQELRESTSTIHTVGYAEVKTLVEIRNTDPSIFPILKRNGVTPYVRDGKIVLKDTKGSIIKTVLLGATDVLYVEGDSAGTIFTILSPHDTRKITVQKE